jgi:hypothetical protein
MTLEQIQKALEHRNLKKVSETTGIPYYTIHRIKYGKTTDPSYKVVDKLREYLEQN